MSRVTGAQIVGFSLLKADLPPPLIAEAREALDRLC